MEKARYEYALDRYEREFEIKERLEKKVGAVFTLATAFLGAIFLKGEAAQWIADIARAGGSPFARVLGVMLITGFLGTLIVSLFHAMGGILLQQYRKEHPKQLHAFLCQPGSRHLESAEAFYAEMAARLALATEFNSKTNARKSRSLAIALKLILAGTALLGAFLLLQLLAKL